MLRHGPGPVGLSRARRGLQRTRNGDSARTLVVAPSRQSRRRHGTATVLLCPGSSMRHGRGLRRASRRPRRLRRNAERMVVGHVHRSSERELRAGVGQIGEVEDDRDRGPSTMTCCSPLEAAGGILIPENGGGAGHRAGNDGRRCGPTARAVSAAVPALLRAAEEAGATALARYLGQVPSEARGVVKRSGG